MTTTKAAIRTLLGADALYKSYIGASTSPYNTFYGRNPTPPTFPFVVYQLRPGRSNQENPRENTSIQYEVSFTVWGQAGNNYEAIADRIKSVLHQKYDSEGNHYVLVSEPRELYDEETNAYGLNLVFNLINRGGV